MEKPANTQYPIHELLQRRWSNLAFSEKPIAKETLYSLPSLELGEMELRVKS